MNKIKGLILGAVFMSGCYPAFAGSYIETNAGLASSNYGIRGGKDYNKWDFSANYLKREIGDVTLHTLGVEVYNNLLSWNGFKIKAGGGVGYSIPNFSSQETADNGHSWSLGGGMEFPITDHWSIGSNLKAFFFTTDTHKTVYSSHAETLSNGLPVEVIDVIHVEDSKNYDSIYMNLALRYYF